jgi:16S rRNA (cytosine967-C5)-methyltransferase
VRPPARPRRAPQGRGGAPFGQAVHPAQPAQPATARRVAIAALLEVEVGGRANEVLPALLGSSGLDERDRSFATELVYGTVRMRRACDWLIGRFVTRELEPVVIAAARAGAYQLAFMRVPAYAAVAATVAECPERARPLLNAVLRRVSGLVKAGPLRWPDLPTRLSYPDWVVEKLCSDLGAERAVAALEKMNEPASASLRADNYVQDPGSQAVCAHLVALLGESGPGNSMGRGPGPLVLDTCSAPGGKATALAASSRLVVAGDVSRRRLDRVVENARRLGLTNVAALVSDGTALPCRPTFFDLVLVDAPCSGLGVLRRRPDARWRGRPQDVTRLAGLQRRLVSAGAAHVKPGGLLAYCVCTLTREETFGIDEWLAGRPAPGWERVEPPRSPWEPLGRGAVLFPQAAGTDGMYLLVLRRVAR